MPATEPLSGWPDRVDQIAADLATLRRTPPGPVERDVTAAVAESELLVELAAMNARLSPAADSYDPQFPIDLSVYVG